MKKVLVKKPLFTDYVKENEFLAYLCLSEKNVNELQKLLEEGMPLTAYMLTLMEHYKCSKEIIKETMAVAVEVQEDVIPWMKRFFSTAELKPVIKKFEHKLADSFTTGDCIKFELWYPLFERKNYKELAKHAPEVLLTNGVDEEMMSALLEVDFDKYVDKAYDYLMFGSILGAKDGWKYLVDKGQTHYVLKCLNNNVLKKFLPADMIVEYLYQKGLFNELYNAGFHDFLLEKKEFKFFVEKHSLYSGFLSNYPQHVDWEDLWSYYSSKPRYQRLLKSYARKNLKVQACYEFLWNHSGLFEMLILLNCK